MCCYIHYIVNIKSIVVLFCVPNCIYCICMCCTRPLYNFQHALCLVEQLHVRVGLLVITNVLDILNVGNESNVMTLNVHEQFLHICKLAYETAWWQNVSRNIIYIDKYVYICIYLHI